MSGRVVSIMLLTKIILQSTQRAGSNNCAALIYVVTNKEKEFFLSEHDLVS